MSNTNSTVKVSNYRPRAFAEVSKSKGEDSVLLAKVSLDGVSSAVYFNLFLKLLLADLITPLELNFAFFCGYISLRHAQIALLLHLKCDSVCDAYRVDGKTYARLLAWTRSNLCVSAGMKTAHMENALVGTNLSQ